MLKIALQLVAKLKHKVKSLAFTVKAHAALWASRTCQPGKIKLHDPQPHAS